MGFLRSSSPSPWDTSDSPSSPRFETTLIPPRDIIGSYTLNLLIFNGCTCFEEIHYNNYCLSAVVLIGSNYVGKTSLVSRFHYDEFTFDTPATIGVDLFIRNMYLGGEVIKVQIWDTGNCITCSIARIGVMKWICAYINSSSFQTLGYWKIRKLLI